MHIPVPPALHHMYETQLLSETFGSTPTNHYLQDVWNVNKWPNPQSPYAVQIVDDPFKTCKSKKDTLAHLVSDGALWR